MKISFRITRMLLNEIHADLSRQHPFAFERVAFISCTVAEQGHSDLLVLASGLHPVADLDYEQDLTVGAMLGPGAFRKALQYAYSHSVAMFHVHRHEHCGQPAFSSIDISESARYVPDFWKVQPRFPHGTLLLSRDAMTGLAWLPQTRQPVSISRLSVIGNPVQEIEHGTR